MSRDILNPVLHIIPHPVLAPDSLDYRPGNKYEGRSTHVYKAHAEIQHGVEGDNLVYRLLKEDAAAFGCVVASPYAAYRTFHLGDSQGETCFKQRVEWNPENVVLPVSFIPVVVATRSISCSSLSEKDGVHESWLDEKVRIKKGSLLALGEPLQLHSLKQGLLSRDQTKMTMHEVSILKPTGYKAFFQAGKLGGREVPSRNFLLLEKLEGKSGGELENLYGRQREFLEIVCEESSKRLPDLLFEVCGKEAKTVSVPLPEPLEDCEFDNPTLATETRYWELWSQVAPRRAAIPAWWASLHLSMIQKGVIQASYLVSSGRAKETREEYIERILKNDNAKEQVGAMDGCIRGIFRHLGGISAVRGYRTVFIDCRTARGWWRRRFAEEAAQVYPSVPVDDIHKSLRLPAVWEELFQHIISRLPAIGDQNLRFALLAFLGETYARDSDKAPVFHRKSFRKLLSFLGRRTTWQVFGVLEADEILEIVRQEAEAAQQEVAKECPEVE